MDDRDVKRRKVTRECIICREDKGFRAFPGRITEACQHVRDICRSCMKQTIKTEIQSKGQSAAIRCPNCAAELSLADVARESSTADAEQLDTFLLQKALSQEPNFVWCAHGCGIGQLVDDLSCNAFMTCQSCGRRTCNHHRTIWHDELSCAEHDRNLQSKQEWQPSFKLDNCTLRSSSRGILYRKSASMQDTINACVLWGTTVRGWPFNDRWIAVGEFFLPTHLRNVRVIQPLVETYQVDNSVLRSSSSGVIYRSSPELGAIRAGSPVARFGSFVEGRILSKKWLKAEGGYLPLRIRGAPILELQAGLKKLMNEKNIKQCPGCRQGIEKRRGCDHMTCKCGAQFCYICGADYLGPSGIFAVGNHVHAESCRHYRPFP